MISKKTNPKSIVTKAGLILGGVGPRVHLDVDHNAISDKFWRDRMAEYSFEMSQLEVAYRSALGREKRSLGRRIIVLREKIVEASRKVLLK